MRHRHATKALVLLLATGGVSSGCASAEPSFQHGDLHAVLSLEPANVTTNQGFDLRVDLTNRGDKPIVLRTQGCYPLRVSVSSGSDGQPGASSVQRLDICTPIGAVETIPPREQISVRQQLVTRDRPGVFDLQVDFNFDVALPTLAGKLRVD